MPKQTCLIAAIFICGLAVEAMAEEVADGCRQASSQAEPAVEMRAHGPAELDRVLSEYDALRMKFDGLQKVAARLSESRSEKDKDTLADINRQMQELDAQIAALQPTIDQVGGQRGCSVSRLYWYTNLDEAKAAAKQTGRPILSLRMLGKLTDEYSCANSRFFRTALYSNKEISDYLRDNFILHWQSVRPVPRVTIDFGDGRKLERTITGNSAHYVLTSDGQPLDVLPGLYGPHAFREWLVRMHELHADYMAAVPAERAQKLAAFHRQRRADVYRAWVNDLHKLGDPEVTLVDSRIDGAIKSATATGNDAPLAAAAARMAVAKSRVENSLLRFANFSGPWIERGTDDATWEAIAKLHRDEVKLDEASVAVMEHEYPWAMVAGQQAITKRVQESPVLRVVRSFESSMALDTVRNEYVLHRRIHERFADSQTPQSDVDALNEWVYAELFLTPSTDPWLGLAPNDVYTALERDGRTIPAEQMASSPGQ